MLSFKNGHDYDISALHELKRSVYAKRRGAQKFQSIYKKRLKYNRKTELTRRGKSAKVRNVKHAQQTWVKLKLISCMYLTVSTFIPSLVANTVLVALWPQGRAWGNNNSWLMRPCRDHISQTLVISCRAYSSQSFIIPQSSTTVVFQ